MIHRKSAAAKIAIGVFLCLFIAGVALPDVFAAGLGSASQRGGSSSPSSSTDRGGGSPIISDKSSSIPSGSSSIPSGSSIPSTTPMSIPSESKTSYKTYTQPGSVETFTSPEGPTGSVGSEASAPGSKKKKAGGGGFPPVDTSDVKASETADTAMAIRGKPAHSEGPGEGTPTKGSDVAGGGSSGGSGGSSDLERLGKKIVSYPEEVVKNSFPEGVPTPNGIINYKDTQGRIGKQLEQADQDIAAEGRRAGQNIAEEAKRAPQNIQELFSGKNTNGKQLSENIEGGMSRLGKNIEAGAKEAGKQLEQGVQNVPLLPQALDVVTGRAASWPIWEGIKKNIKNPGDGILSGAERDVRNEAGRAGQWLDKTADRAGSDIRKGAKQLEDTGKKVGGTIGKAAEEAGDEVGKAVDKASDYVSDTAQQGQDTAEETGSSAAEQVCDWFGC